jgi:hypothetical protein
MNTKSAVLLTLIFVCAIPVNAKDKDRDKEKDKKNQPERGMLEKMDAVPCGAKERGLTGLGSIWASAGVTHVDSDQKLCPEYLLRSDEVEYHIRPTDGKHPVVLPVGHEGVFRIKKDQMFLKFEDGDGKTRTYRVVGINPTPGSDAEAQDPSKKPVDKP